MKSYPWSDQIENSLLLRTDVERSMAASLDELRERLRVAEAKLAATPPNASAAEVTEALKPVLEFLKVNDGDTLSRLRSDGTVLATASGSWSQDATLTLGHLRAIRAALAKADAGGRPPVRDVMLVGPVNGMGEQDAAGYYFMLVLTDNDARSDYLISRGAVEVLGVEIAGIDAGGWPTIESAPKDGSQALVIGALDPSRVWVARYNGGDWYPHVGGILRKLTHWHHLPASLQQPKQEGTAS